ncbi:hypothetical protein KC887_07775 [Candidatus Kaiserbacteria bacterium]|nr:hypothetical protein [Candidatus Kaiserbacteria bacterium]
MGYRENVQSLCNEEGIENPIREEDLWVVRVDFYRQGEVTRIFATDMNRAGRLFFQSLVVRRAFCATSRVTEHELRRLKFGGEKFFAENWQDAEEVGRAMLIAFKAADGIVIHWR